MIVYKNGRTVRLISRNGVDHTERFRELAAAVAVLKAPTLILDGEVCVFDKNLVSQFHLLDRSSDEPCTPPVFMAFDCLHGHGLDVRGLPLHRRRAMLEREVHGASMIYAARRLPDNGLAAWAVVKERGYEGLVAKDVESVYPRRPDPELGQGAGPSRGPLRARRHPRPAAHVRRHPHWSARRRRLLFRGTVEWGIGIRTARELLHQGGQRSTSPFHDFGLSRGVTWLEPTLTVELTYSELMEGRLRDPGYRGLV
jgi:bifunctional non-homologous end joining protein LigD